MIVSIVNGTAAGSCESPGCAPGTAGCHNRAAAASRTEWPARKSVGGAPLQDAAGDGLADSDALRSAPRRQSCQPGIERGVIGGFLRCAGDQRHEHVVCRLGHRRFGRRPRRGGHLGVERRVATLDGVRRVEHRDVHDGVVPQPQGTCRGGYGGRCQLVPLEHHRRVAILRCSIRCMDLQQAQQSAMAATGLLTWDLLLRRIQRARMYEPKRVEV